MLRLFKFTARRTLSALVISMAVSAPALADPWRQCPYDTGRDDACCYKYHQNMRDRDDRPMMQAPMLRPDMRSRMAPGSMGNMGGKQLGVMVSDLPNALLDEAGLKYGINVESVQSDSAAAQAGIQAGDLITEFDGSPVYSAERLRWLVRKAESGKTLEIKLMREQKPVQLNAILNAPKPQCPEPAKPASGS